MFGNCHKKGKVRITWKVSFKKTKTQKQQPISPFASNTLVAPK